MPNTEDIGRQAAVEGFANEHIAVGLLMKKYQNVSLVDLPLSPYDIIIVRNLHEGGEDIIRVQVKTAKRGVSFTGGTRGGVDREYKSGVKTYTHSPKTSDVVIGLQPVDEKTFDMYIIPTLLIAVWGTKSKGLGTIQPLKNNYDFLENCKDRKYIMKKAKKLGII